ncbi:MAG TPA: DUF2330 domain-containing protein [Pseudomonadales bacterium]|nr:DUF2330 domain-containing protein [Pseudomonadales bacterium]
MKTIMPVLVSVISLVLVPVIGRADGVFVAPKFVWDKHKDINEPTQKAIIVFDAGQEDLILQVKYEGPVGQFGWLIPVPNLPTIQEGSMKCFYELSKFTQKKKLDAQWEQYKSAALGTADDQPAEPSVKVLEIKTVGAYETAVLEANDSSALEKWLNDNHFYIPPDKFDVIAGYIKEHYYFVAVKINFSKWFPGLPSTPDKLAAGELNPLQIHFASDRCVFPLRISSINGTPSEVQFYVLASEPLLEQVLYEKQLPLIYSNDMARAESYAQKREQLLAQMDAKTEEMRKKRGLPSIPPSLYDNDQEQLNQSIRETPILDPDEALQFAKATDVDLPECTREIPRLARRSWWIAKDTWTFQPADMYDLDFGPALPVFAETLGSKYGYIALGAMNSVGVDAIPILIAAMQSPNRMARADAASILDQQIYTSDPQIQAVALSWLTNAEPKVRRMAIYVLADKPGKKPVDIMPLVPLLSDKDADVREAAAWVISHSPDAGKNAPIFHKMLLDPNPAVRISALRVIQLTSLPIDHSELLPFFKIPDRRAIGISTAYFGNANGHYDLTDEQAIPLLQNAEPVGRLIGLRILGQHADARAIELACPLLNDTNPAVKYAAKETMQKMTGQDFMNYLPTQ